MLLTVEKNELCTTCNHVDECLVPRSDSRRPVVYCEEFDDYSPAPPKENFAKKPLFEPVREDFDFKGLCINCEHRDNCIQARTEGGVWHCEEYE